MTPFRAREQMFRIALCVVGIGLVASPASAQSRFYAGGIVSAESGPRVAMPVGTFPAAGGLVGWRFSDGWSLEVHADRGFQEGTPHGRLGHFGVDTLQDHAAGGLAVLGIWKFIQRGRVAAAISMGLSGRTFRTDRTVGVDRPVGLPPDDPLLQNETGTTLAAGPTGGFMLPVSLGGGWSVAPELRVGIAATSDGIYFDNVYLRVYSGVRVMWGF
jgi:hypothetical protein